MQFMDEHKTNHSLMPLFLYYATTGIRAAGSLNESSPPSGYDRQCSSIQEQTRRNLCQAASAVDASIGNVADKLQGWGDDYVLIVTSDNGGATWNFNAAGSNWPLRGNKNEAFEGGIRVKALVTGSQVPLARRGSTYTRGMMHLLDWHMLIAQVGGYSGTVNNGRFSALAQESNVPQEDQGLPGLWDALVNDRNFARQNITGKAIWGARFYISWPYKVCSNTGVSENSQDIRAERQISGHWWPVRSGFTDTSTYLQQQHEPANLFRKPECTSTTQHGCTSSSNPNPKVFDLSLDPNEENPLSSYDPDIVTRLAAFQGVEPPHHRSGTDACESTSSCHGNDDAAIDQARINALPATQRALITEACPDPLTYGPHQCLSDSAVQWCPTR